MNEVINKLFMWFGMTDGLTAHTGLFMWFSRRSRGFMSIDQWARGVRSSSRKVRFFN